MMAQTCGKVGTMMWPTLFASARHLSSKSCIAPSATALRVSSLITLRGIASGASCEVRPGVDSRMPHACRRKGCRCPCTSGNQSLTRLDLILRCDVRRVDVVNCRWVRTCSMAQRRAHPRCAHWHWHHLPCFAANRLKAEHSRMGWSGFHVK